MARPKSLQHELKRDEILDIAAQCFADSSYLAASMTDTAAAGGMSKARLYHYYESKEAIEEYEHSATRHVALLHDTKFLGAAQRDMILDRQRDVVSAVTRYLRRAYPGRVTTANQTPLAMMLFGMINWTFPWLRPDGAMSYAAFADEVIAMLEGGLS